MDTGLQDYVFTAKYSVWDGNKQRRETYQEACDRVLNMHKEFFNFKGIDVSDLLETVRPLMYNRTVLGSQRALQFGGNPILRKHLRLYNCAGTLCDRPRAFQEILWVFLCGTGVGLSIQKEHVAKLPPVSRPAASVYTYQIPDTIEGWADALGMLLSSYFAYDQPFPEVANQRVEFDYSAIRPKGSAISTGIGRAPGPGPLRASLEEVRTLLDRITARGLTMLKPIEACDIICHTSDAVLAGGVRRSAALMLFSPDDEEMMQAKTGNWMQANKQRARSNNSVALLRDSTSEEQFMKMLEYVKTYGEPGFLWVDDANCIVNPCAEISIYPIDRSGQSGFGFCNLSEVNMQKVTNETKFAKAAEAAAILGTLQAAYTDFPYLGKVTEDIVREEALLGVSLTGMMERPNLAFNPEIQRAMAQVVKDTNATVAKRIGIRQAARTTCIKPSGTAATILGTSSGIHPHHSHRYIRHVQSNALDPITQFYIQHNPLASEKSVWDATGTDVVLSFCVEPEKGSRTKKELSPIEFLELISMTKKNWIDTGRNHGLGRIPSLSHNVSCTVIFKPHELEKIGRFIYQNRENLVGVSLLADGGDLDYPQAPFVEVLTAEEVVKEYGVGAIMASGLIVDGLAIFGNNLWAACSSALGRGTDLWHDIKLNTQSQRLVDAVKQIEADQQDWVRRAVKFAQNYFDGDILRMTRCLKRVHTCKQWADLIRNYKPVDYTQYVEYHDTTKREMEMTCTGGACSIIRT